MKLSNLNSYLVDLEGKLKKVFQNDTRVDGIIANMKEIYSLESEKSRSLDNSNSKERRNLLKFHEALKPNGAIPGMGLSINRVIPRFLVHCVDQDANSILSSLERSEAKNSPYLNAKNHHAISVRLYEDAINSRMVWEPGEISSRIDIFFLSLMNICYKKLGLESTIKLVENLAEIMITENFKSNSTPMVIRFLDAIDYCMSNPDYPIEWLLSVALDSNELSVEA